MIMFCYQRCLLFGLNLDLFLHHWWHHTTTLILTSFNLWIGCFHSINILLLFLVSIIPTLLCLLVHRPAETVSIAKTISVADHDDDNNNTVNTEDVVWSDARLVSGGSSIVTIFLTCAQAFPTGLVDTTSNNNILPQQTDWWLWYFQHVLS